METPERIPQDRLSAVDLRRLSDQQLAVLREEAIRRKKSLPELLGELVDEISQSILSEGASKLQSTAR